MRVDFGKYMKVPSKKAAQFVKKHPEMTSTNPYIMTGKVYSMEKVNNSLNRKNPIEFIKDKITNIKEKVCQRMKTKLH